jgi:hypothetical protein
MEPGAELGQDVKGGKAARVESVKSSRGKLEIDE